MNVGDRVRLSESGERRYGNQSGGTNGTVTRVGEWSDVSWDNGHSNNYEAVDLDVLVEAPVVVKADPEPRVKYLYSVETVDGETQIMSTRDREHAREVKAYCGGKKEGVVIMAYAPVKEIR